jgi:hypothetical protein
MPLFRRGDHESGTPARAVPSEPVPAPSGIPPAAQPPPGAGGPPPARTPAVPPVRAEVPGPAPPFAPPAPLAPDPAYPIARFPATEGDLPCRSRGCANHTAVLCHYVDRRGRRCDTSWCPNHWATVGGIVYCRRHAGTIAAIGYFDHPSGMPDVDNRAPSLVNWVARDLDAFVAATLVQSATQGETFVREPVVSTHADRSGGRRYERGWKLVDHTGLRLVVAVFLVEGEETTVRVRVGSGVVAEGVPPWIERHRRGVEVTEETDRNQRALFYAFLQKHIVAAVRANRAVDQRLQQR